MQQLWRHALPIWHNGWPLNRLNKPMTITIHGVEDSLHLQCNWNLIAHTLTQKHHSYSTHSRICWPSQHSTVNTRLINSKLNKKEQHEIITQLHEPPNKKVKPTWSGYHLLQYNNQWQITCASINTSHVEDLQKSMSLDKIDILDLDYFCMWRVLQTTQQPIKLPAYILAIDHNQSQIYCFDQRRWGVIYQQVHHNNNMLDNLTQLQRQTNLPRALDPLLCIRPNHLSINDQDLKQLFQVPIKRINPHMLWKSNDTIIHSWQKQHPVLMSLALGMYRWKNYTH